MDTAKAFRMYAYSCEWTAKTSGNADSRGEWQRIAQRWLQCAKLAEDRERCARDIVAQRQSRRCRHPPPSWSIAR